MGILSRIFGKGRKKNEFAAGRDLANWAFGREEAIAAQATESLDVRVDGSVLRSECTRLILLAVEFELTNHYSQTSIVTRAVAVSFLATVQHRLGYQKLAEHRAASSVLHEMANPRHEHLGTAWPLSKEFAARVAESDPTAIVLAGVLCTEVREYVEDLMRQCGEARQEQPHGYGLPRAPERMRDDLIYLDPRQIEQIKSLRTLWKKSQSQTEERPPDKVLCPSCKDWIRRDSDVCPECSAVLRKRT